MLKVKPKSFCTESLIFFFTSNIFAYNYKYADAYFDNSLLLTNLKVKEDINIFTKSTINLI